MDAHGRIRAPLPRPERLQPLPDLPDGLCRDIPADAAAAYAAAGASDTSMAALQELTGVSYTGALHIMVTSVCPWLCACQCACMCEAMPGSRTAWTSAFAHSALDLQPTPPCVRRAVRARARRCSAQRQPFVLPNHAHDRAGSPKVAPQKVQANSTARPACMRRRGGYAQRHGGPARRRGCGHAAPARLPVRLR